VSDFFAQHWRPALFFAGACVAFGTLAYKVLAGVVRGMVLSMRKPKALGESGAAAAEFVIVVIPFMLMLTGLMQLSLASLARVLVSYSAFTAARAAIVVIPMAPPEAKGFGNRVATVLEDEQPNNVGYGANTRTDFAISHKASLIRNAAAYPLIAASPSIDVVVQDVAANWADYLKNRLLYGLDPLKYLESLWGDLGAIPRALLDGFTGQLQGAIQGALDTPEQKQAAKDKVNDWIEKNVSDPAQREKLKQAANDYIEKYKGTPESPTGQAGNWVKDQINGALAGPLEKFRDKVNDSVNGALGGLGGGGPGSFKGAAVDRALDAGFGSGTDGAGGAILRSLRKLVYARMGTVVSILDDKGNFKSKFEPTEPIKVRVTHLFYCQIPLANRFAGKPFYNLPDRTVADLNTGPMKGLTMIGIPGYFLPISAEHTLPNQGKP
jgi:hypothetical protein